MLIIYKSKNYSFTRFKDTHFTSTSVRKIILEIQWEYQCTFNFVWLIHEGLLCFYSFERKLQKGKNYSDKNLLALDLIIDDNRDTVINI